MTPPAPEPEAAPAALRERLAELDEAAVIAWVEAFLLDFAGDLYGREIEVEFVAKLRDEVKFDSLDALTAQMKVDAAQARDLLSKVNL